MCRLTSFWKREVSEDLVAFEPLCILLYMCNFEPQGQNFKLNDIILSFG